MRKKIRNILRPLLLKFLDARSQNKARKKIIDEWKQEGYPVPPPHVVKQSVVREFQRKTGYSILVETGTYLGDMVEAQKSRFKKIISIELSRDLFEKARIRFKEDHNIDIVLGDSGKLLPRILEDINRPAIFWLDGHYSAGITAKGEKDSPIFEELIAIFKQKKYNHVILIDDARHFTGEGDYPSIKELTKFIESRNDCYEIEVKYDIIRCVMKKKRLRL